LNYRTDMVPQKQIFTSEKKYDFAKAVVTKVTLPL